MPFGIWRDCRRWDKSNVNHEYHYPGDEPGDPDAAVLPARSDGPRHGRFGPFPTAGLSSEPTKPTSNTNTYMKRRNIINKTRGAFKLFGLAVAVSAAFLTGNAQAATTTQTYDLGSPGSGTTIGVVSYPGSMGNLVPWIARGTLPAGSILRSVSVNVKLDAATSDSWTSDLLVYFDAVPEDPGIAALLQIGGDYSGMVGTVSEIVGWNGGDGGPGTTITETKTAGIDWTGDIDLNAVQLSLGNNYATATWSGTVTVEYDISALSVAVISPAVAQGYPTGTSITATANVLDPGAFTDTVTFHTTPLAPAGPTVDTLSAGTTSPFTAVLGALPAGTYEIYATVVNTDTPPGTATSATNTFTVAAGIPTSTTLISSINPSTYGQNVTFTATVSPLPTGGTVQFYDGASALGIPVAVNTSTGEATYSSTKLGAGTHGITAAYSGHWLHGASTSALLTQVVDKAQLTVKALNVLRAPNTPNPDPFPYLITGYQNGETLATSGVTGTPTLTTAAVLSSPVGNYDITCAVGSLAAANYSFTTLVNGNLTVAAVANTFSVNFYVGPDWPYGGLTTDEQKANVLVPAGVPAGLGDWYASGWLNFLVPWAPTAPLAPVTLTSTLGSTATFTFKDCRNGWTYDRARTTLLGDGNGNMMDAHVNSTLDPGDGSNLFDMEVTDIPFAVYDVIFYMGANKEQYGDGTGVIVFNGGAERGFTVKDGAFDGTFTEMVDATTPGNYIVFTGVTGASFTTQTWGIGFNHLGPCGFQIRDAVVPDPAQILAFDAAGRAGVIDQVAKTITVTVPYGTDLATLAPTFMLSSGACTPTSGTAPTPSFAVQNPATYTVTDGAITRPYTVTVTVGPAPIIFSASGAPLQTFDALSPVTQWSTLSVAGAAGDVTTDAGLDTMMTGIAASSISTTLGSQAGSGTTGNAYWRSGDQKLGTQPTGNKATLLMARIYNNAGSTVTSVLLTYTLGVTVTPAEEIKGHRLYWSKTGLAGSWTAVGDSTLAAPGSTTVSTTLNSLNWANGSLLYVVWADDNGSNPDGDYTIDNVSFALATPPAPTLPPGSLSMSTGTPTFTAVPTVSGYTYWLAYKDSLTALTWTRLGTGWLSDGSSHTFTDPTTPLPAARFYRLEVQ